MPAYVTGYYYRYGNTSDCTTIPAWIPGVSSADVNDGTRDQISNAYFSLFGRYGESPYLEQWLADWIYGSAPTVYGSIINMIRAGGDSNQGGSGELQDVQAYGKHTWGGQGSCPPPPPVCSSLSASLSLNKTSIVNDGIDSATLSWSITGDKITSISVTSVSSPGTSGSVTVKPASTTSYYLTVTNECGVTYSATSVTLNVIDIPLTLTYFRANDQWPETSVYPDEVVTFTWSTLFNASYNTATSASINQGIGPVATGAKQTTIPAPSQDTVYTITISDGSATLSESVTVKLLKFDDEADPISFSAVEDAELSTVYDSNVVTISGLQASVSCSASNGALTSVNGGAFSADVKQVSEGDTLQLRMQSSASFNTQKTTTVSLGEVNNTWKIRTKTAPQQIPNNFDFNDVEDAPLLSYIESNSVVISGITEPVLVTTPSNGFESSVNGGLFDTTPKNITNGQTLKLRVLTSNVLGDTQTTGVLVGDSPLVDWNVVNVLTADNNPNYFDFLDKINQIPNSIVESDVLTIEGINVPTPVTVTNGAEFRINGGAWTTTGNINVNQTLQLRILSSPNFGESVSTSVTVGNLTDLWTVFSTTFGDTIPDAFYFADRDNQPPNTYVLSNTVLISGITAPAPVSVTGGQCSINGNGWIISGSINNGDTLRLRILSSSSLNTAVSASISIG